LHDGPRFGSSIVSGTLIGALDRFGGVDGHQSGDDPD
jgi:hypothetical protein